jgi:hypothetical protein
MLRALIRLANDLDERARFSAADAVDRSSKHLWKIYPHHLALKKPL